MEAGGKRTLKNGREHDGLFPKPAFKEEIVEEKASLEDTMRLIREVIKKDCKDTVKLAQLVKRETVKETCHTLWNFVYQHIQYIPDRETVEEIRRPARLWADRASGGDCDCMSVFIGTTLQNLKIPYTLRIAEYNKGYYQHIYPVVITDQRFYSDRENRRYYTVMDCVKDQFDSEHPYKKIKDYDILTMNLAYLSGFDNTDDRFDGIDATPENIDTLQGLGLSETYFVDGLGKLRKKRRGKSAAATAAATAVSVSAAASTAITEVKKFYITNTRIYRLSNGTVVKPGRPVRSPGENVILFQSPGQENFTESGVLNRQSLFVDTNDIVWGIATVNNSYWKKPLQSGWQRSHAGEYAQAQNSKKAPLKLRGYILKDGTRIFLDRRAPKTASGYPVKWKAAEEEGGFSSHGELSAMMVSESQEFVIGKNGHGNYYKSAGYKRWQQIPEEEYNQLRARALRGFNDLGSLFTMNGNRELSLNSPGETKGLYIPYDVLETLFSKRLDPARNYSGIAGLGFLLGDDVLDAIAPFLEGANLEGEMEGMAGEEAMSTVFGEVEIFGMDGYFANIGDTADLIHELKGDEALLVADGLGRVRRKRAKRTTAPATTAPATAAAAVRSVKKLGLYIPARVLNHVLKIRSNNLSRLQSKGIEITGGTIPSALGQPVNGFFDKIRAPLKAVVNIAKFIPIPGISVAANLVSSAIPANKPIPGSPGPNQAMMRQQQDNAEAAMAYDQSLQGFGLSDIVTTVKKYRKQILMGTGALVAYAGYKLLTDKKATVGTLLGMEKPKRRKRKKSNALKVYKV